MKRFFVLFCFVLVFVSVFSNDAKENNLIVKVDVNGGVNFLRGWRYYPNKLLEPGETNAHESVAARYPFDRNDPLGGPGFGTYQINLRVVANGNQVSILFPLICSAYQIWINEEVVAKQGLLSRIPVEKNGRAEEVIINLPSNQSEFKITVQVSNFHYYFTGLLALPKIGRTAELMRDGYVSRAISNIFFGCIIGLIFLNIILFIFYPKNKEYLWLTFICLCISIRAVSVNFGSNLVRDAMPDISILLIKRIEFFSVYAILIFFPLYIYSMCKSHRRLIVIACMVGMCVVSTTIFLPLSSVREILDSVNGLFIIELFYFLYMLSKQKERKSVKTYMFVGLVLCIPILINGMLTVNGYAIYYFRNQIEFGLLLFCLSQTFVLASDNARIFNRSKELNASLDREVETRTKKLAESINTRDVLLSTISHDLRSPINSLNGLLTLFKNENLSVEEFKKMCVTVGEQLKSLSALMDSILAWAKVQSRGIKINLTSVHMDSLIVDCIDVFAYAAKKKDLQIKNRAQHNAYVLADEDVMKLVLRNLLSNSIKFSEPGKTIEIDLKRESGFYELIVRDYGIGLSEQSIKSILESKREFTTSGTLNEKGHGFGLPLCVRFLSEMGTSLRIESVQGRGSSFHVQLKGTN